MKNILLLALAATSAILLFKYCSVTKQKNSGTASIVEAKKDTGSRWTDQAGREHLTKQVEQADMDLLYAVHTREIDSFTRLLKIERDQVKAYAAIGTRATGTALLSIDTVYVGDTTLYHLRSSDRWLTVNGEIGLRNYLDYDIRDSLIGGVFFKNTGFLGLGRGKYMADAYSLNPNVTVTGLTTLISSIQPPGRLGIGPYVGIGYDGKYWRPSIGISLQYSLIRIK